MGFVKISDNLPNWAWYGDNNTLLVYIRLLLGATWRDTDYQNITLKRGQIATTLPKIAKENGITERQVRTILDRFKSTGKITVERTSKFSIITLIEYDCAFENVSQSDCQLTGERQTVCQSNVRPTLYKSDIHITEKHTTRAPRASSGGDKTALESSFGQFWAAYPRKVAKPNAFKAWKKLKPDDEIVQKILSALEQQKKSVDWLKDNGQYVPFPATWLNGRRWEDEIQEVQNGKISGNCAMPTTEAKSESDWLRGFNGQ